MILQSHYPRLVVRFGIAIITTALVVLGLAHAEKPEAIDAAVRLPFAVRVIECNLSSSDTVRLESPLADKPVPGHVVHLRSGQRINVWETFSIARQFYSPIVMGSFPRQVVVIPYLQGGGTGYAVVAWGILEVTEAGSSFSEMGLWTMRSHSKDRLDFEVAPRLGVAGDRLPFQFQYNWTREDATSFITGRLELQFRGEDGPVLVPLALDDAEAIVQLIECPGEDVGTWATGVLRHCIADDAAPLLDRLELGRALTDTDHGVIIDSLRDYFAKFSRAEKITGL